MTILSPRLALNLNYLLLCHIACCHAARATPRRTPPLPSLVAPPPLSLRCASLVLVGCCIASSLNAPPSLSRQLVVELPPLSPHRHLSLSRFVSLPRCRRCRPHPVRLPPSTRRQPQFEPTDPPPPPGLICIVDVDVINDDIIQPPPMITASCPVVQSDPRRG